jgi:tRNA pseudouridine55 synthase
MISGVLVIDKPQGPTSHDMVAVARRALGERRIGHCGTLDPMATGVLVLAVGQATRLVQFLIADEKHYDAVIRFGRTTDSYDATGDTTGASAERPTREAVEAALAGFRGSFQQTPPAFSAKRHGGARAYDLARRGHDPVGLRPATVVVSHLELTRFDGDLAAVSMRVSAGFYVRSLAHDLGQTLGMGATLEALRRTRAGRFGLPDAVSAEGLATGSPEALADRLQPLDALMPDVPGVTLSPRDALRARRGLDVPAPRDWPSTPPLARLLDERGGLIGLATPGGQAGFLHPSVVLG